MKVLYITGDGIGNVIQSTPAMRYLKAKGAILHVALWRAPIGTDKLLKGLADKVAYHRDPAEHYDAVYSNWLCPKHEDATTHHLHVKESESTAQLKMVGADKIYPTYCWPGPSKTKGCGVGLHLGGKTTGPWLKKRWPVSRWRELVERIGPEHCTTYGTESDDHPGVNDDLRGVGTLSSQASWIADSDFFISHDSGLAHVAAALEVPTYVLFGPTCPFKNKPPKHATVIRAPSYLSCRPCQHKGWPDCDHECMDRLKVDDVWGKIEHEVSQLRQSAQR